MRSFASPSSPNRPGDVAATLWLLGYLALAGMLIVLDHRGGWLAHTRGQASLLVQPLWVVAGWPGRVATKFYNDAGTIGQLSADNERLRNELLVNSARIARLQTLAADNARLRGLLDAADNSGLDVQLAPILDIDLDPTRQRLVVDAGGNDGVHLGQSVIDAGGLLGQIIDVQPTLATVLLVTDAAHAVPVAIERNGVRLVVYGEGRSDLLRLPSVPLSSDVKVGDKLLTSALGGRFPAGFPVGTIVTLHPDESRAFLVGEVRPAAQLDRGRDVLLLRGVLTGGEETAPARPGGYTPQAGKPLAPAAADRETGTDAAAVVPANAGGRR